MIALHGLNASIWRIMDEGLPVGAERDDLEQATRRNTELGSGAVTGRSHDEVMRAAQPVLTPA